MTNKILILTATLFLFIGNTYGQYCTNNNRYTENTIYTLVERASCFFKSLFCNQCTSFSTTAQVPATCSSTLSAEVNILASTPKVYPNPFDNSFKIEGVDGVLDITICDSIRQLVYKDQIDTGDVQINLLPGIYFLTIRQLESNMTFTTKLIKN